MTPEQKQIVQNTWQLMVPTADTASCLFYERLFEIDPTTRPLFRAESLPEQKRKLMQVLGIVVRGLDDLGNLMPIVEDLGRRHSGYGVTEQHYQSVGSALLWTLRKGLGQAWTAEAEVAWCKVYALLSGVMRSAAASSVSRVRPAA